MYVLFAAFGTVAGVLAMPVVTSSFADGTCPGANVSDGNCVTGGETTVNLNLLPVLGLWLSSSAGQGNDTPFTEQSVDTITTNGKITPKPMGDGTSGTQVRDLTFSVLPGQTATVAMNARVMTNSADGYKLFVETTSAETRLMQAGASTQFTKSTGTIASQLTDLATGTWGVKGGDVTNWIGVPASGSGSTAGVLKTGSKTTVNSDDANYTNGSDTVEITFGANATSAMDSGVYTGTVRITAVVTD